MKKILFIITGCVLLSSMCFLIYSCVKKQDVVINPSGTTLTDVPAELLQAAKDWEAQQIKVTASTLSITTVASKGKIAPKWKGAKMEVLGSGKTLIVVESPAIKLSSASKQGMVRKFVYNTDGKTVTGGRIIEMYGSSDYMANHSSNLLENYNDGKIAGDFSGAVIQYDVNYNYISSTLYKNGNVITGSAKIKGNKPQTTASKTAVNSLTVLDDGDCWDVYLEYYYTDEYGNEIVYADDYLYSYCDDDSNELGGNNDGIGGGSNSSQAGDPNFGVHHLNTSKIPPLTTTDLQLPNYCVFKTMEWVSRFFGTTILSLDYSKAYLQSLDLTWANDPAHAADLPLTMNWINTHAADPQYLVSFVTQQFTGNQTTNVTGAIDAGYPVMGTINNGTHEVMITGYNNDGTYEYFDPLIGCYNHAAPSNFTQTIEITGF